MPAAFPVFPGSRYASMMTETGAESIREGVVAVVRRDGRFLLIRRAEGILAGGAWCFVGGGIETGEPQADALLREFREETGGAIRAIEKIWEYRRPDGKLLLHWWLAELLDDRFRPDPAEVSDLRWCNESEIRALPWVLDSNLEFLDSDAGRRFAVPAPATPPERDSQANPVA